MCVPRQHQRRGCSRRSGQCCGEQTGPATWRGHASFRGRRGECVPQSDGTAEHESLESPREVRQVSAEQALQSGQSDEVHGRTDQPASTRSTEHERRTTPRPDHRLGTGQPPTDTARGYRAEHHSQHGKSHEDAVRRRPAGTEAEHDSSHRAGQHSRQRRSEHGRYPPIPGESHGATQTQQNDVRGREEAARLAHDRNEAGAGGIPATVAQEGTSASMSRTPIDTPQGFCGSQSMEMLGDLSVLVGVAARFQQPLHERFESRVVGRRRLGRAFSIHFLEHVRIDEAVAVSGDGPNEVRIAWVITQGATEHANCLGQRSVGNHDVAPHGVQDVLAMHRLVAPLEQQQQQVEVPRDQRHRLPLLQEGTSGGRDDEIRETVPWPRRIHER